MPLGGLQVHDAERQTDAPSDAQGKHVHVRMLGCAALAFFEAFIHVITNEGMAMRARVTWARLLARGSNMLGC